ncbi:hypothetical protein Tco_0278112 [Tanacetum coccineum]
METHKPLLKDADGEDVDEHMYRSMIGSLMYLTSLRPDIMFVVCVCARFQVNPKVSHLHVVKRIFKYLKGQPKLGFWYPKDSPFDLVAYTDSDYVGASLDRKSTTREAEYVTKIHIDNDSTICIVKNLVFHSKTKHIKIRHHFIRDSNEKKLIQMIKIHIDKNVADLLTKAFDVITIAGLLTTASWKLMLLGITYNCCRGSCIAVEDDPIADEAANEETVPTQSNDPLLSRFNTLRSGEDKLTLKELMDLYTKLSDRVLDLETTKTA